MCQLGCRCDPQLFSALVLETSQNEVTRRTVAESLGKIGTGNERAIQALVNLLETSQDKFTRRAVADSLGKIGTGNETAVRTLVHLLEITQDGFERGKVADSLGRIGVINGTVLRVLVQSLRHNLRSKEAYQLMMECAERMPYKDFFQTFHSTRRIF